MLHASRTPAARRAAPSAVCVALAAVLGVPGAPAAATGTVTWALSPADETGPDGRISLRHVVDPGATVTDHVVLSNFSESERTFLVYAGDGTISGSGDFDIAPREAGPTAAGAWVRLGEVPGAEPADGGGLRVTVPATTDVTIPLVVAVPDDAAPGDHPAGLVAELADDGATVQVAARVGVRLHLRVTGEVVARVAPDDLRVRHVPSWNPFAPGEVHVEHDLVNDGHVRLGATTTTTVAGPFGLGRTSARAEHREILPGGRVRVVTVLEAWPTVRTSGRVEVVPHAVGEDDVPADLAPVVVPVAVWSPPWAQLALLVALAGLVLAVREGRRRAAARFQARLDAAVAAATAGAAGAAAASPAEGSEHVPAGAADGP